jgi:hypothetical protein
MFIHISPEKGRLILFGSTYLSRGILAQQSSPNTRSPSENGLLFGVIFRDITKLVLAAASLDVQRLVKQPCLLSQFS